jgi:hypothetical protein
VKTLTLFDLPWNIAEHVTVDPDSGCWRGTGLRHDKDGYARIGSQGAHRVVYKLLAGEIPDGHQIDHVEKRGCVWRDCLLVLHLEAVTPRINCLRGNSFAAINFAKTHCGTCGCPFDLYNTYWYQGRRDCRCCIRARVAKYNGRPATSHPELRLAA